MEAKAWINRGPIAQCDSTRAMTERSRVRSPLGPTFSLYIGDLVIEHATQKKNDFGS